MAWSDFLSNIDWGGVAQRVIPAAIGSYMVGNANQNAAQTVANANTQATQAEINAQNAAQARLAPIIQNTAPAIGYLRGVMSDTSITPQQQQYIADTRRTTAQQLQPNLGGRSATAIATKSANDVYGNVYQANRARSDAAAGTVAGMNMAATGGANALDTNTAQNIASGIRATGNTIGAAGLATADTQAKSLGTALSPNTNNSSLLDALASYNASTNGRKATY